MATATTAVHAAMMAANTAATLAATSAVLAKRRSGAFTSAIIVSAGNSSRMGGKTSKQLLEVSGVPVLERTLAAFRDAKTIDEIVVVSKKEFFPEITEMRVHLGITIPFSMVEGGDSRALSVQNGFAALSPEAKFVAIHDGARCLITPEEIDRVCRAAYRAKAATAAHKVSDSVKIANRRGYIDKSLNRDLIWLVQTPQVFDTNLYRAALETAKDTVRVTDDNALIEQIGYPVKLVECSTDNIKITVPGDIERAEDILRKRGRLV